MRCAQAARYTRHTKENVMNNRKSGPAWPSGMDLPKHQASMSHRDWIRFYEHHIRDIEAAPSPDRYRLADTRRVLLLHRRSHFAALGKPCPRWKGRLV